jgi:16S rRNA (cytosine967-C5)-methyltransferase
LNNPQKLPSPTLTRKIAHGILVRVIQDDAFLDRTLDAALKRTPLPPRDAGLVTELTYGTLRRQIAIDFVLQSVSNQPLSKLAIPVLVALRLGVYQLLYMRVAPYSAVNETVILVRAENQHAAGYANAILRKIAAASANNTLPTSNDAAILCSMPLWILKEIAKQRSFPEAVAWANANNIAPPVSLRVNRWRNSREQLLETLTQNGKNISGAEIISQGSPAVHKAFEVDAPLDFPDSLLLERGGAVDQLPGYKEGLFTVQDPAATLLARMLAPSKNAFVLDACAAPGGKTLHAAEWTSDGKVLAIDIHAGKARLIRENAERLGADNVIVEVGDATQPSVLRQLLAQHGRQSVDAAIVDAPCSGLGTLRRHPELRFRAQEKLPRLKQLQEQLLDSVASVIRPGGILVYTVCTVTQSEGPERIREFLQTHSDFVLAPPDDPVLQPFLKESLLWTWTDKHGCDSFFGARLQRVAK